MPLWRYMANDSHGRRKPFAQRQVLEFHTGYRAFSSEVLSQIPLLENSDDFVFDKQMIAQIVHFGFRIGEVSVHSIYGRGSSINFRRSCIYGFGVLWTALSYRLSKMGSWRAAFSGKMAVPLVGESSQQFPRGKWRGFEPLELGSLAPPPQGLIASPLTRQ